jgi:hypothetical protein
MLDYSEELIGAKLQPQTFGRCLFHLMRHDKTQKFQFDSDSFLYLFVFPSDRMRAWWALCNGVLRFVQHYGYT